MDTLGSRCREGPQWFLGLEMLLDIIAIATHINALWVLPAAYYICSDLMPSHTLRDTPSWNDSRRATVLRNVLAGKINLEIMDVAFEDFIGTSPCSGCIHREQCGLTTLATARRLRSLITQRKSEGIKRHTLKFWRSRSWLEKQCKELCEPCSSACMSAYESTRGDYWDKIPLAFNLPGWEELKLLRETAFSE